MTCCWPLWKYHLIVNTLFCWQDEGTWAVWEEEWYLLFIGSIYYSFNYFVQVAQEEVSVHQFVQNINFVEIIHISNWTEWQKSFELNRFRCFEVK